MFLGPLVAYRQAEALFLQADLGCEIEALRHKAHDLPVDIGNLVPQPCDFRLAQTNPPANMRSRNAIATAFSTTGTARGTMQGSCRPVTTISVGIIVARSTDRCGFAMDAVGLTATRNVTGMPFVMPPRIPPAWFVSVTTRPASTANGSLCSLPRMDAARKPAPKSTPFTAGIEKRRWASADSMDSKNGSPPPGGRPPTTAPMMAPTPSRALPAAPTSSLMRAPPPTAAQRNPLRSALAS